MILKKIISVDNKIDKSNNKLFFSSISMTGVLLSCQISHKTKKKQEKIYSKMSFSIEWPKYNLNLIIIPFE